MTNSAPSRNPANDNTLEGMLREVLPKFLQSVDDMLPARVVSHDRAANRVTVQPMIKILGTSGESLSRQPIPGIPVFNMGGGGFIMSFDLNEGDLGWIKANDKDISLFLQNYSEQDPNTLRKHKFSDAIFFPDVMTGYDIASEDSGNWVIQNLDGTVKISLGESSVKITSPVAEIDADTVLITASTANIDADQVNLGSGGQPIARLGDAVQVSTSTGSGTIIAGGVNTSL